MDNIDDKKKLEVNRKSHLRDQFTQSRRSGEILAEFRPNSNLTQCFETYVLPPPLSKIMKIREKKLSDEVLKLRTCSTHEYSMLLQYEVHPATLK